MGTDVKLLGTPGNILEDFHMYGQCCFPDYSDGHCLPKAMLTGSEMVRSASASFQSQHHAFLLVW